MRNTVSKASYFDASYQRRDLYEKGPTQGSLRTNKREPGALSKTVLVKGGSMGVAAAYGGHLKPSNVLSHQGIPPTLPVFDGQPSSSLILWLVQIKSYFLSQYIPKSVWCEVAVSCLKGSALIWYDLLNFSRRMEGKRGITSWHKLEFHMKKRFTFSCTMSDLTTQLETLKQNPLNINKNAKPNTQPLPEMKPKLKDIQTNSNPKPEFNEPTELELTCSPNAMNCVSNACIAKHLNPIESGRLTVDHEGSDESINPAQLKPSKLTKTDLTPTHCENKNPPPKINPKETICCVNTKPQQNSNPIFHLTTKFPESPVKHGPKEGPYFPLCPGVYQLIPNISPQHTSETHALRGEKPDLFTPPFHYPMLLWLRKSLVQVGTYSPPLSIKESQLSLKKTPLAWNVKTPPTEYLGGLKFTSHMLSKQGKEPVTFEMGILKISKGELCQSGGSNTTMRNWPDISILKIRNADFSRVEEKRGESFTGNLVYTETTDFAWPHSVKACHEGALGSLIYHEPGTLISHDIPVSLYSEMGLNNNGVTTLRGGSCGKEQNLSSGIGFMRMKDTILHNNPYSQSGLSNLIEEHLSNMTRVFFLIFDPGKVKVDGMGETSEIGSVLTPRLNHLVQIYDPGGRINLLFGKQPEFETEDAIQRTPQHELKFEMPREFKDGPVLKRQEPIMVFDPGGRNIMQRKFRAAQTQHGPGNVLSILQI